MAETDADAPETIITRVRTRLDERLAPRTTVLVAHLYAVDGSRTSVELGAELDRTRDNMADAARALADQGLLVTEQRPTDTRGPPRKAYDLAPDVRAALADAREWDPDALAGRLVTELARHHYVRQLSSAKSKRLAREIPGASSQQVRVALGRLRERDIVERLGQSRGRWRLADVSEVAPFRDPTAVTSEGEA